MRKYYYHIFCIFIFLQSKTIFAQIDSASFQTFQIYNIEKKQYEFTSPFYKSLNYISPYIQENKLVLKSKNSQFFNLEPKNNSLREIKLDSGNRHELTNPTYKVRIKETSSSTKQFKRIEYTLKADPVLKEICDFGFYVYPKSQNIIATFGKIKIVSLFERAIGNKIKDIIIQADYPTQITFSSDETKIAIATNQSTVEIYSLPICKLIKIIEKPSISEKVISDISFLGNKSLLITYEFPERGNLFLFTLAIDKYQTLPLFTCVKDAKNIESVIKESSFGIYDSVFVYRLYDSLATLENIKETFSKITGSRKKNEKETLILYLGGHSLMKKELEIYKQREVTRGFITKQDETFFACYNSKRDTSEMFLSGSDLSKMINDTEVSNRILIGDAASSYGLFENLEEDHENSISRGAQVKSAFISTFIFGINKGSVAFEDDHGGLLTNFFINYFKSDELFCPNDGKLSSFELNARLMLQKQQSKSNFKVFTNNDFTIRYISQNDINYDILKPNILIDSISIPKQTIDSDLSLQIRANDNKGVKEVLVNSKKANFLENNKEGVKYTFRIGLQMGVNYISTTAVDINGLTTTRVDTVYRRENITKNYAYFFASDDYDDINKWIKLNNAVKDAKAIASELSNRFEFDTVCVVNPTVEQIDNTLTKTKELKGGQFNDGDQLFIFFSGHGYFDEQNKRGALVAKDSKGNNFRTYYSYADLENMLAHHPCKHIFLVIDACYSGTFFKTIAINKKEKDPINRGIEISAEIQRKNSFIENKLKYKTRIALTSAGKDVVSDGNYHSPFAEGFLKILRTNQAMLTTDDIQNAVKNINPFPILAPFEGNESGSDFIFSKNN